MQPEARERDAGYINTSEIIYPPSIPGQSTPAITTVYDPPITRALIRAIKPQRYRPLITDINPHIRAKPTSRYNPYTQTP
jgi:hypothetical protein